MAVDKDGDRVDLGELLDEYQEHKKLYRFEGDSGLKNLETLLTDLGYAGHSFGFGSPIESFLSDNPGAVVGV